MRHRHRADLRDQGAFSIEGLAQYIDVGRSTAYELVRTDEIPSFKIGRLRRVTRAAADAWLQNASNNKVNIFTCSQRRAADEKHRAGLDQ